MLCARKKFFGPVRQMCAKSKISIFDSLRSEELPGLRVILVYPFDGFQARWGHKLQCEFEAMLPLYDKVVRVSEHPSREAYLERDRHLVDGSSICLAYCTRDTGGTAYTVRYARKQGLEVVNMAQR